MTVHHYHIVERNLVFIHDNKDDLLIKEYVLWEMRSDTFNKENDYFDNDWMPNKDIKEGIIFEGKFIEGDFFFLEEDDYNYEQVNSWDEGSEEFENLEDANKRWESLKVEPDET